MKSPKLVTFKDVNNEETGEVDMVRVVERIRRGAKCRVCRGPHRLKRHRAVLAKFHVDVQGLVEPRVTKAEDREFRLHGRFPRNAPSRQPTAAMKADATRRKNFERRLLREAHVREYHKDGTPR